MGLSYTGFTTGQRGIEADETGINTEGFSVTYKPQFKDFVNNYQGQKRGFCIPDKLSREVTISGKVITSTTTGVMAFVFATAATVANDVGDFVAVGSGTNAGGLYVDEATVDQTNDGWRSVNMKLSSDPLIT